ncbi:MAG: hypothetical protein ACOX3D_00660 [Syntrophomonadales bacterium]|jgi:uncharacterized membrane protein YkvI
MKRNTLAVAWGYMGAVIGAGFVSGQELVQFFVNYGIRGTWGVIVAGALFALCGGLLMSWVHAHHLDHYQSVLKSLFGRRYSVIIDSLLAVFLFLGICIMFAASGAVFYEHINQSKTSGVMLAYITVLIFLLAGRKGMIGSFNLLVPLKFLLLLSVAGYAAILGEGISPSGAMPDQLINPGTGNWLLASVLYVAYNFSLAMVVLAEYQAITSLREGARGAFIGGALLGVIALVCYYALLPGMPVIAHYEIPMLFVAGSISAHAKTVYMAVLWLGILTTAIANTYGFAQRFSDFSGLNYNLCLFVTVTMALPLAFQSFAFLVATVYPLLGILGIVILVVLVYNFMVDLIKSVSRSLYGIVTRLNKGG